MRGGSASSSVVLRKEQLLAFRVPMMSINEPPGVENWQLSNIKVDLSKTKARTTAVLAILSVENSQPRALTVVKISLNGEMFKVGCDPLPLKTQLTRLKDVSKRSLLTWMPALNWIF
jgi:hypothetical protein